MILFNFFTESKCSEKWNLLKYLHVVDMLLAKDEYENYLTKHLQKGSEKDEDKDAKDKGVKENEIEELAV